jgi:hypothetical protein
VVKIFEATLGLACVSRAFNMGGKTTWAAIRQRKLGRFLSPRDHNSGAANQSTFPLQYAGQPENVE